MIWVLLVRINPIELPAIIKIISVVEFRLSSEKILCINEKEVITSEQIIKVSVAVQNLELLVKSFSTAQQPPNSAIISPILESTKNMTALVLD